jgi:hypothetical protein
MDHLAIAIAPLPLKGFGRSRRVCRVWLAWVLWIGAAALFFGAEIARRLGRASPRETVGNLTVSATWVCLLAAPWFIMSAALAALGVSVGLGLAALFVAGPALAHIAGRVVGVERAGKLVAPVAEVVALAAAAAAWFLAYAETQVPVLAYQPLPGSHPLAMSWPSTSLEDQDEVAACMTDPATGVAANAAACERGSTGAK